MRIPRDQIYDTPGLEPLFPMATNSNYVHLLFVNKFLRNLGIKRKLNLYRLCNIVEIFMTTRDYMKELLTPKKMLALATRLKCLK